MPVVVLLHPRLTKASEAWILVNSPCAVVLIHGSVIMDIVKAGLPHPVPYADADATSHSKVSLRWLRLSLSPPTTRS